MNKTERKKELLAAYKERPVVGGVCAIRCAPTGKTLLFTCDDPKGKENRFDFSVSTNSCVHAQLATDWAVHGPRAFVFSVLEELPKKAEQTLNAYYDDLKALELLWRERLQEEGTPLY